VYPLLVVPGLVVGGVPRKLPNGSKRVRLPETGAPVSSRSAPTLPRWSKAKGRYVVVQVLMPSAPGFWSEALFGKMVKNICK
jgi:hypothetical protein